MGSKEVFIKRGAEETIVANKADNIKFVLEEGAHVTYVLLAKRGWSGKPRLEFEFAGSNSSLDFFGFVVGSGNDIFRFEVVTRHNAPRTKSRQQISSAMFGRSLTDFTGNIIVEKTANLTDAHMAHRTLLLSPDARARTLPALEIKTSDVKAGHAATAGKVDKEMLFYLQSRGITHKLAERLLITAFFESQVAKIYDAKKREFIRREIAGSLKKTHFAHA